jgi:serine/threonine-protein kinase CHEK2
LTLVMKSARKRLQEDEAKFLFHQLCVGLKYLHDQSIVHRDLKVRRAARCTDRRVLPTHTPWCPCVQPDNLLLCAERGLLRLKIADFGFAKLAQPNQYMVSNVGTVAYRGTAYTPPA